MRKLILATMAMAAIVLWELPVRGHDAKKNLPPGPIHDRHELMEGVGDQAKIIGDALKTNQLEPVGPAAAKIHAAAGKALPLFPKGSAHPDSRAKPEIWEKWSDFEADMQKLETDAAALEKAASGGGDVKAAAQAMFGDCKHCHEDFRVPEKKK